MAIFNSHMFYLGNYADMDPNETNTNTENPGNLTAFHAQPPLVAMTVDDGDDDGAISDDDMGNGASDTVTYDLGGGATTQHVDSSNVYGIRVTLGDNSTIELQAVGIQMQNGDVFLTEINNDGSLDNLNVQSIQLLSVDGSNYGGFFANQSVDNSRVVCFAAGTLICTPSGMVPVEDICRGMAVLTKDHGAQRCLLATKQVIYKPGPAQAPVRIAPGALGPGLPERALSLSPQHRVLLASPVAQRMTGSGEVLVAAKELAMLEGVTRGLPFLPVTYVHLMFDAHELLDCQGIWAESLLLAPESRKTLQDTPCLQRHMAPARPILRGKRARNLLARHLKSCAPQGKPLCPAASALHPRMGALTGQNAFEAAGLIQ